MPVIPGHITLQRESIHPNCLILLTELAYLGTFELDMKDQNQFNIDLDSHPYHLAGLRTFGGFYVFFTMCALNLMYRAKWSVLTSYYVLEKEILKLSIKCIEINK